MTLRKVGRDLDANTYWQERATSYEAQIDGPYHRHRLAVVKALLSPAVVAPEARCIDYGCGDGVVAEFLVRERGARVLGIEPSATLIESASRRLDDVHSRVELRQGGLDALAVVDRGSIDCLAAINVLAYMSDEEERRFYIEAARALRIGGCLVVTHSNSLFDLFSLNAFTVQFFREHLVDPSRGVTIETLLTQPHVPDRITFNVRENPLAYRHKLAHYGFDEERQEFASMHPAPPLLMDPEELRDIDSREYPDTLNSPLGERWKLLFTCSMFGSQSRRQ